MERGRLLVVGDLLGHVREIVFSLDWTLRLLDFAGCMGCISQKEVILSVEGHERRATHWQSPLATCGWRRRA